MVRVKQATVLTVLILPLPLPLHLHLPLQLCPKQLGHAEVVNALRQHLTRNIVRIGKKWFYQTRGIPQVRPGAATKGGEMLGSAVPDVDLLSLLGIPQVRPGAVAKGGEVLG